MRVLLIEDDPRVARHVAKGLGEAGHRVDHLADGREGLYRVAAERYDAVVLDRMLPNVDGLTILQTMRAAGDRTPVLILSALGEVDERVRGLRAGGDDYLVKPFALSELTARLDALQRRSAPEGAPTRLAVADLEMDLLGRQVQRGGRRVDLSPREFRILEHLLRHAGQVVTRSMLLEAVWDYHFDPQTNIIDQHVSRLRQKVDRDFPTPLIHTVRGVGYVLRGPG
ncbi:winged helix-turn-helix domain-containing protein [Azospirillum sp. ST 5-10]|uniref:winged helix-turn-helix domain-containing protein n=1 Tax=unclassified Azospirillum TaxID=2630922 RepID=UPI003F4A59AE